MNPLIMEQRLYLVIRGQADGSTRLDITRTRPITANASVVIRSRGTIGDNDITLMLPRLANDGRDASAEQIASAVAAYLTAHPPAPGRAPTSMEIGAAVAGYFSTTPPLTKTEFNISLTDAYLVGLLSGADQKRIACAGLKTTDALTIQPTAVPPAGYGGWSICCTENGWSRVGFVRPNLAVGANNTIPLRITAFR